MAIKEIFGFKIETKIAREKGETVVESYTLFSEAKKRNKTWVELHMGIKGAAIKNFVIAFEQEINRGDYQALKDFAQKITEEYAEGVAAELIDSLPD